MADDNVGFSITFEDGDFLKKAKEMVSISDVVIAKQKKVGDSFTEAFKKSIKATEEENEALNKLEKNLKDVHKEQLILNEANKQSTTLMQRLESSLNSITGKTKKLTTERIALLRTYSRQKTALKEAVLDFRFLGTSMNDVKLVYNKVISVAKTAIKVFGTTKVALAGLGLGAVVLGFKAVQLAISRTQEGADKFTFYMAGIQQIGHSLLDTFAELGNAIINTFSGDKIGALSNFNKAFDIFLGIRDKVDEAFIIQEGLFRIRDREIETNKFFALNRSIIKQLKKDAEDVSKTDQERINAGLKAFRLEEEINARRVNVIENKIRATERLLKNNDDETRANAQIAINQLILQQSDLEQNSTENLTTLNNLINTIEAQRLAKIKAVLKELDNFKLAYEKITKDLEKSVQEINLERLTPRARIEAEKKIVLDSFDEMEKEALKLAELSSLAPIELFKKIADIQGKFKTLREDVILKSSLQIDALPVEELKEKTEQIESLSKDDPIKMTVAFAETDDTSQVAKDLSKITDKIGKFFNSPEFQKALDIGFQLGDAIATIFDAELLGLEKLNDERQDRIDQLKEDIELEEELLKEGSASRIQSKKDEIEQLLAEQEAGNKRANELRKKQIEIETAQAIASQAASLGSAVGNIFNLQTKLNPFGVFSAIAMIATMLATVKSAQAQIKSLSLHTGAERIGDYTGYVDKGHSTDRIQPNSGLRVIRPDGTDTRVRLGGNEMIVDENTSRSIGHIIQAVRNSPTLGQQINDWYDGVDATPNIIYHSNKVEQYNVNQGISKDDLKVAMTEVMDNHLDKYFKKRGNEVASDVLIDKGFKGTREVTLKNGNKKRIRNAK